MVCLHEAEAKPFTKPIITRTLGEYAWSKRIPVVGARDDSARQQLYLTAREINKKMIGLVI